MMSRAGFFNGGLRRDFRGDGSSDASRGTYTAGKLDLWLELAQNSSQTSDFLLITYRQPTEIRNAGDNNVDRISKSL